MSEPNSADMKLVVVGAAGRMGRMLVRAIDETPGVMLHAALEHEGSPALGKDSGVLAGLGENGIAVSADPLEAVVHAEGMIDFSTPATTVAMTALAAQARIAHVIGTTGLSADDLAKIAAAARHAPIVRSGNMSLGVNLLAALVEKAAQALGPAWDIEVLEMHHRMKVDAPSGTALLLGEAAAKGRGISLDDHAVRSRDGHTGARRDGDIGFATSARRNGRRRSQRDLRDRRRASDAHSQCRRSRPVRARRTAGGAMGARPQARACIPCATCWASRSTAPTERYR